MHAARLAAEVEGLTFQPRISAAASKLERCPTTAPWCDACRQAHTIEHVVLNIHTLLQHKFCCLVMAVW